MNVLVSVIIIFIYTSFHDIFLELYSSVSFFRHLISRHAGDMFTGRNEVVAKVMFLLVSVILSTLGVLSQHALQLVSGVGRCGGCLLWGAWSGGVCSGGVAFWFGLLIEGSLLVESGLLLWPSGKAFWYGISPNRPFQPEGHTRMAFWYGLLM